MIQFNIGGVPEHFNLPWLLAIEENQPEDIGLKANWQDFSGGTGAMAKDLREGKLDMAMLLTEGAIADIIKGGNYRIASLYVNSPLTWGIHVHHESSYKKVDDLKGKTYGISRYGSGSHLMAFVDAQNRGWNPDELKFEVVGNMDGAREALANGKADAFMWEKFTTKPLVDSGEWRRIGERPTPWPCFVIVVREDVMSQHAEKVAQLISLIQEKCKELKENPKAVDLIAQQYGLKAEDTTAWFKDVRWAESRIITSTMLKNVMNTLLELKIIDRTVPAEELCNQLVELV